MGAVGFRPEEGTGVGALAAAEPGGVAVGVVRWLWRGLHPPALGSGRAGETGVFPQHGAAQAGDLAPGLYCWDSAWRRSRPSSAQSAPLAGPRQLAVRVYAAVNALKERTAYLIGF